MYKMSKIKFQVLYHLQAQHCHRLWRAVQKFPLPKCFFQSLIKIFLTYHIHMYLFIATTLCLGHWWCQRLPSGKWLCTANEFLTEAYWVGFLWRKEPLTVKILNSTLHFCRRTWSTYLLYTHLPPVVLCSVGSQLRQLRE